MNIPRMYTIALGSFGYTEDEARFLYLVATHSGYFTCQQFVRFIQGKPGKRSQSLVRKLVEKGHASARPCFATARSTIFSPGIFTKPSARIMFDSVANTRPNTSAPGSSRLISF